MWPWSKIAKLERAVTEALRECEILRRRADWFARAAKAQAKTYGVIGDELDRKNRDLQVLLAQEQRAKGTYIRTLQAERVELFRRIEVLEKQQVKKGT